MTLEEKLPKIGTPEWEIAEEKYAQKTMVQDIIMGGIILTGGIILEGIAAYEAIQERNTGQLPFVAAAVIAFGTYYISKAYDWRSERLALTRKLRKSVDA